MNISKYMGRGCLAELKRWAEMFETRKPGDDVFIGYPASLALEEIGWGPCGFSENRVPGFWLDPREVMTALAFCVTLSGVKP